jgi:hypothetical protein
MPLTPEIIESQKLTPEQVTALNEVIGNDIAEVKKTYDGKANADAEAILEGAAKAVETKTGIAREKGQKIAEYITLAGERYTDGKLSSERTKLEAKQKEYDDLIKSGASDASLKKKYEELQTAHDNLQKKEADYDRLIQGDYENLYNNLKNEHLTLKQTNAFSSVKPAFPDTVNKYEADAKWGNFVSKVKTAYDIDFNEEGKPIGISKENKHKTVLLSSLVEKDEEIKALTQGKKDKGTGTDPKPTIKVKDVPFDVPENATSAERQKAITDYLLNEYKKPNGEKITRTSPEWAKLFSELNTKLLQGTAI